MSSNRLKYDACEYAKKLSESTSPLDYQLFKGKYENSTPCECNEKKDVPCNLDFGTRADVEAELLNINRVNSKCPETKYNPANPNNINAVAFHPPTLCQSIYHLTPSNLKPVVTNGLEKVSINGGCEKK